MNIWISVPTIIIPNAIISNDDKRVDSFYEQVYSAYSEPYLNLDESSVIPRLIGQENEKYVVQCIDLLRKSETENWFPSLFVDCRSSAPIGGPAPTYRIIKDSGIITTLPILLQGQAGSEVLQAIILVSQMKEHLKKGVLITALQRVVYPDSRSYHDKFQLGDAVAAIGVASSPLAFGKSFHVVGFSIAQCSTESHQDFEFTVKKLLRECGITNPNRLWAISPSLDKDIRQDLSQILPDVRWVNRDIHPDINFGCADSLISLHSTFVNSQNPPLGIGLLWFAGRFGSLGLLVLDPMSVNLWHSHTHKIPDYVKNR